MHPDDLASIRRHLRRHRPDAIICCNDKTAAIFKRTLDLLGIRVPEDILLAGFDDVSVSNIMSPPLTTIHQPCELIAKTAFDRLLARIADPDLSPAEILLNSKLIVRESTVRIDVNLKKTSKKEKHEH